MIFVILCGVPNFLLEYIFFLDDYRFERIWRLPWRYIPHLRNFDVVLSPDFSLYTDMPQAMKIWNVYRSRLLGQMMQRAGCRVIPTVSWAYVDSFDYCFEGIIHGSVVAVSTVGTMYSKECRKIFLRGFEAMIEKLNPDKIILYGKVPDELKSGKYEIISFSNTSMAWKYGHRGVSYKEIIWEEEEQAAAAEVVVRHEDTGRLGNPMEYRL